MKLIKEVDEILEKYKINETAKILILYEILKTITRFGFNEEGE